MLRHVLFQLAALSAGGACFAQTQHSHASYLQQHHPAAFKNEQRILAAQQENTTAAKSTVMKARLIATSAYDQGELYDTTRFFYTGMRGSGTILSNSPYAYISADFDGTSNIAADSSLDYQDNGGGFALNERVTATYSSTNKILTQTDHNFSYGQYYGLNYTYNTAGYYSQIVYSDTLQSNTTTLQPSQKYYVRYNAQNKVIYDSLYDIVNATPTQKDVYTYNAAGYQTLLKSYTFTGSQAYLTDSSVTTYDAGNRMKTYIDYTLSGGILQSAFSDSLGYTGANTLSTSSTEQSYDPVAGVWSVVYATTSHLNSAGNNYDTTIQYELGFSSTNSLDPFEKSVALFNSDGTLHQTNNYYYNNGVLNVTPDGQNFFYYEQYTVNTGVHPIAGADDIKVYPNPAESRLNISLGNDAPAAATGTITITDGSGRQLLAEAIGNRNTIFLNLGNFPAGWYNISVIAGNGSVLHNSHFIRK